ncbi:crotonyl-CoA carboxylase/reductase [Arboricoccus pini]|uniref:Crotonyl-CoA carboxylase/reductase n=1 Tax=Arboricoccus pini TaxID=1963835 RepID=A0A212RST9_9PROT|nr:crotonyl-CoA carboxylase/reductase [Arboricoccus pini]SNB75732.1 crotonyl-CoA carboxylase/reductase [Arboricoccus pini]
MGRDGVARIIAKFGSQQRLAEQLGIWQTAVSGWVRRGAIPTRRQAAILTLARREGIALTPADFFDNAIEDAATGTDGRAILHLAAPRPDTNVIPLRYPPTPTPRPVIDGGKDLYEVGEIPPLGHVPANMYAWVIRKERHGEPIVAMQQEIVPTPALDGDEVLVMVMAAGVDQNGVWAALGYPHSVFDIHKGSYHIAGSDAAGIVWAAGPRVTRWRVGDEVVVHCSQDDGDDEECNGGDPMNSPSQRIWGYETPDGSFAQFCKVQSRQLMSRPRHLPWEESGCYVLALATAYRMLFGHPPHTLKPGDNVLVWGGAGGLGAMAIQLIAASGANAIAVISDQDKRDFVMSLGAKGTIDRRDFDCWGELPAPSDADHHADANFAHWQEEARRFHGAIWTITGEGNDPDIVFEHPGASTFPVSTLVCRRGGMVVLCAGTTGYKLTLDARHLWMRQKRIQGSHFANLKQAASANRFVHNRQIDPCLAEVLAWRDIPRAHMKMLKNQHKPGNIAVLVQARRPGLRTLGEAMER